VSGVLGNEYKRRFGVLKPPAFLTGESYDTDNDIDTDTGEYYIEHENPTANIMGEELEYKDRPNRSALRRHFGFVPKNEDINGPLIYRDLSFMWEVARAGRCFDYNSIASSDPGRIQIEEAGQSEDGCYDQLKVTVLGDWSPRDFFYIDVPYGQEAITQDPPPDLLIDGETLTTNKIISLEEVLADPTREAHSKMLYCASAPTLAEVFQRVNEKLEYNEEQDELVKARENFSGTDEEFKALCIRTTEVSNVLGGLSDVEAFESTVNCVSYCRASLSVAIMHYEFWEKPLPEVQAIITRSSKFSSHAEMRFKVDGDEGWLTVDPQLSHKGVLRPGKTAFHDRIKTLEVLSGDVASGVSFEGLEKYLTRNSIDPGLIYCENIVIEE